MIFAAIKTIATLAHEARNVLRLADINAAVDAHWERATQRCAQRARDGADELADAEADTEVMEPLGDCGLGGVVDPFRGAEEPTAREIYGRMPPSSGSYIQYTVQADGTTTGPVFHSGGQALPERDSLCLHRIEIALEDILAALISPSPAVPPPAADDGPGAGPAPTPGPTTPTEAHAETLTRALNETTERQARQ
jgi:hypothetical protein